MKIKGYNMNYVINREGNDGVAKNWRAPTAGAAPGMARVGGGS